MTDYYEFCMFAPSLIFHICKVMEKLFIAEIRYANCPELSSILLRVYAESISVARYKVGKYIEESLGGQRVYRIYPFENIKVL